MRRAIQLVAHLYPRSWRERYGEEFDALIEDHKPGWREFSDVLRGAFQMQLTNTSAYWKLAAAAGVAGVLVAIAISFSLPGRYQSTAVVRMAPRQDSPNAQDQIGRMLNQIQNEILSRTSLEGLITSPRLDLYRKDRRQMPMEEIVQRMRTRDVQIRIVPQPAGAAGAGYAIAISFAYPDQLKAQAVARELVTKFTETTVAMQRTQTRLWQAIWPQSAPPSIDSIVGEVLDPPSLPEKPVSINRASYASWGLAAGLALGLIAASAWRRPKWTLQLAAFGLACFALAFAISQLLPSTYTSTCVLRMMPPMVPEKAGAAIAATPPTVWLERLKTQVLSDASLEDIIRGEALYASGNGLGRMRKNLRIARLQPLLGSFEGARTFAISFTDPDSFKAQAVVIDLTVRFTEQNVRNARERERASGDPKLVEIDMYKVGENIEVMDPPSDPQEPVGPNRLAISFGGLALGLLLGAITLRSGADPLVRAGSPGPALPQST